MSSSLKRAFRDRTPVAGCWISIGHPTVAELSARLDYAFVVVDTEHAATTVESVEGCVRAVEACQGATEAVVRVPWNDPVRIKRVLDAGPSGVVVPMVEDGDEAASAVEATRYPPDGIRGIAAARGNDYGAALESAVGATGSDDRPATDESGDPGDPVVIVQVESETAVGNAGAIAATDGVDAILVGPADLSAALGVFGEWDDDRFVDAVASVLDAGESAGTPVGTLATEPTGIERWHDRGYDYLITGVDANHLTRGAREAKRRYDRLWGSGD